MKFIELARQHLSDNGMFDSDVEKVIELAKQDKIMEDTMTNRWNDDLSNYPPATPIAFTLILNTVAVKYIDENMPFAWFRPVFAGK